MKDLFSELRKEEKKSKILYELEEGEEKKLE